MAAVLMLALPLVGQNAPAKPSSSNSQDLEAILTRMDRASANFKSAQA